MKKILIAAGIAGALLPTVARAQLQIDMTRVTCGQYLAMAPDIASDFSAWMSGWYNQKSGYTKIDLDAYNENVANVKKWCESNPKESVMAGLQRAVDKMSK